MRNWYFVKLIEDQLRIYRYTGFILPVPVEWSELVEINFTIDEITKTMITETLRSDPPGTVRHLIRPDDFHRDLIALNEVIAPQEIDECIGLR